MSYRLNVNATMNSSRMKDVSRAQTEQCTTDQLAAELRDRSHQQDINQLWIGIAGPPGSGKSTLAGALKTALGDLLTIIPMDGFHYYRHELDAMPDPAEAHARRGAPFTFNAEKFVDALLAAKRKGKGTFPGFDHGKGDPVEDEIQLLSDTKIVLVEGNYLLLDKMPWHTLSEKVFDETWFLEVPLDECSRRVYKRHLKTGKTAAEARRRVDTNDNLNAQLIQTVSPQRADRILVLA